MFCTEGETEGGKRGEGGIAGRERWKIGRDEGERGTIGSVALMYCNKDKRTHTRTSVRSERAEETSAMNDSAETKDSGIFQKYNTHELNDK